MAAAYQLDQKAIRDAFGEDSEAEIALGNRRNRVHLKEEVVQTPYLVRGPFQIPL